MTTDLTRLTGEQLLDHLRQLLVEQRRLLAALEQLATEIERRESEGSEA